MISEYVNDNWKPNLSLAEGWEVKVRAQHVAVGVAQIVAGAADAILSLPFIIPSIYSRVFQKNWTTIEDLGLDSLLVIDLTIPRVVASFLRVMKPDAEIEIEEKYPYFTNNILAHLKSEQNKWTCHRNPLVSEVAARILGLYMVPVSVIALAMDIVATPLFLAAAIVVGGRISFFNSLAANSIHPCHLVGSVAFAIILVFNPRAGLVAQ